MLLSEKYCLVCKWLGSFLQCVCSLWNMCFRLWLLSGMKPKTKSCFSFLVVWVAASHPSEVLQGLTRYKYHWPMHCTNKCIGTAVPKNLQSKKYISSSRDPFFSLCPSTTSWYIRVWKQGKCPHWSLLHSLAPENLELTLNWELFCRSWALRGLLLMAIFIFCMSCNNG